MRQALSVPRALTPGAHVSSLPCTSHSFSLKGIPFSHLHPSFICHSIQLVRFLTCSTDVSVVYSPQGLCICCPLCLRHSSPRYPQTLPQFLEVSTQMSHHQQDLPWPTSVKQKHCFRVWARSHSSTFHIFLKALLRYDSSPTQLTHLNAQFNHF